MKFGLFVSSSILIGAAFGVHADPPWISYQPQSKTVTLYQPVFLQVIAYGTPPLFYAWRKDGVSLGNLGNTLQFGQPRFSDAGLYSVVISNLEGSITSTEAVLTVNAPRPGDVDFTFSPDPSFYGSVGRLALQRDGKVLVVGRFHLDSDEPVGFARLNVDGSWDTSFAAPTFSINGGVSEAVVQPNGKVLLGGYFRIAGASRTNIVRLNADGTLDESFQNGLAGANSTVLSIAVQNDGKILVAGEFTSVNGSNRNRIARLNTDGTVDSEFLDGMSGADNVVTQVAIQSDGKILIAGCFNSVDGVNVSNLARLSANGSLDESFQKVMFAPFSTIRSLAIQSDGRILIGGSFITGYRTNVARLNVDGTLDDGFLNGLSGTDDSVNSLAVQRDGQILIGGEFTTVNGVSRPNLARLNVDGSLDDLFQSRLSGPYFEWVEAVALQNDGRMLVGWSNSHESSPDSILGVTRLWGSDVPPQFKTINRTATDVNLTWYASSNRTYRVQYAERLPASSWTDLPGDILATSGLANKTDATPGNAAQRFYRLKLLP